MKRWQIAVDQQLKQVIGDGDVSGLPGSGQPLPRSDDLHTPPDLRAAHKIMRDHDALPDWVLAGRALDELESQLRQQLATRAISRTRALEQARSAGRESRIAAIESNWKRFREDFTERAGRYNRDARLYNLKAPAGIAHKPILDPERMIADALAT